MRACAVETHVKISQEPLYTKFTGKMRRPRMSPEHGRTLCASLRSRNTCQDFTRATLYEIYRKNAAPQIEPRARTNTLCEPAQSKRMSRFHKSHFIRKFTGKMPHPRMSPEHGRTLCASLRSRNTCQDFTRATLYGNL